MNIQEILDKVYEKDIRRNFKLMYLTMFPTMIILTILLYHTLTLEIILIAIVGTFMFFLISLISSVLTYKDLKRKIDKNVKVIKIVGKIIDIRTYTSYSNNRPNKYTVKDINNLEVTVKNPLRCKYFYVGDEVCLYIFKENDDINENKGIMVEKDFERKYK